MTHNRRPPRLPTTAGLGALATLAWLVPVALLVVAAPVKKKRFDEFGMQLPSATKVVLDLSSLVTDVWWLVLPAVVTGAVLVCGVGTYLVRHHVRAVWVRVLWWPVVFGPPLLATGVIVAALLLPEIKLREGLSK